MVEDVFFAHDALPQERLRAIAAVRASDARVRRRAIADDAQLRAPRRMPPQRAPSQRELRRRQRMRRRGAHRRANAWLRPSRCPSPAAAATSPATGRWTANAAARAGSCACRASRLLPARAAARRHACASRRGARATRWSPTASAFRSPTSPRDRAARRRTRWTLVLVPLVALRRARPSPRHGRRLLRPQLRLPPARAPAPPLAGRRRLRCQEVDALSREPVGRARSMRSAPNATPC